MRALPARRQAASAGLLLATLGALLASPSRGHAYEEQWSLELDAGYAQALPAEDAPGSGLQLGLTAGYGPNDVFTLRLRGSYALHPAGDPFHVAMVGVEAVYLLDVLTWVPYFGGGVAGVLSARDGRRRGDLALTAVVGVDYLVRRDLLVGVEARGAVLPTGFASGAFEPGLLSVALKVGWLFDGY
ncbi:MAG: hypothetical protein AAF447_11725 [Myxococcota bacterium]